MREWPKFIPEADREFYLQRGTAIHEGTALIDAGTIDWQTVDPRIEPYLRGWEKFRREVGGKIVASEAEVIGDGYVGHLDRVIVGSTMGESILIDIKTTQADIYTRLQTMGYALAYKGKGKRNIERGYVALHNNGTYKCGLYDKVYEDQAAWKACVTLANWKERNGLNEREE